MKVLKLLVHFLLLNNNKTYVRCHYPSDYSDLEGSIRSEGNNYYHSKTRRYEISDPDADIGETVINDNGKNQFAESKSGSRYI